MEKEKIMKSMFEAMFRYDITIEEFKEYLGKRKQSNQIAVDMMDEHFKVPKE